MADDAGNLDDTSEREERLFAIVRTYTAAVEAGEKPDRRALLKQHPDLAADLSACLGGLTFLNNAAGALAATAQDMGDATLGGPQLLGDYRLVREIGRGGMGVVYEAEQLSLGRRVAVKVLPTAAALDKRQLQRFRNEAQAAAQLRHTHIVPVYAVGCEKNTHFYAMQLIDGQSLADVIADLKQHADLAPPSEWDVPTASAASSAGQHSSPSAGLSALRSAKRHTFYQSVARLGLQAADALHHAHHAGIVHRDIKPANLLLDTDAGLWITDFGLAQFYAAEQNLTQSSDRPGTLRYMSPEQAAGRVTVPDQRTDVYSLGVTLYELLTLEKAVSGDTREQLLQRLLHEEIAPARTLDASIPKELETILITATAKDPAERYITAGALAEDLRRFLDDQPILAKPPPASQRVGRWVRRHRTAAWATVIAGVLLLVASAISTVLLAREQARTRAALYDAKEQAAAATRERRRAQANFAEARDAVDYFARVAATELTDDRPAPEVRREMLEAAIDYYEAFLRQRRADATQARGLTEAQAQLGRLIGELATVEDAYRQRTLVRLLGNAGVQAELDLSPDQQTRATDMMGELATGRFANEPLGDPAMNPAAGDARDRLARLATQIRTRLSSLLSVEQLNRLRQIARQARGPGAFFDPDVQRLLGLTLGQKEQVRAVLAAARAEARRPASRPTDASDAFDRFDPDAAPPTARARALAQLAGLLDAPQTAVWTGLIGRPYADAERLDPDAVRRLMTQRRGPGGPPGDHNPYGPGGPNGGPNFGNSGRPPDDRMPPPDGPPPDDRSGGLPF